MPAGSDLDCTTASADLKRDTAGSARSASGPPRATCALDHVEGSLELKTASGDVRIEHVDGPRGRPYRLRRRLVGRRCTGHGQLGLRRLDRRRGLGDLTVDTVSGDQIVRAAGPARSRSRRSRATCSWRSGAACASVSTSTPSAARSAPSSTSATRRRAPTARRRSSASAPSAATSRSAARPQAFA